MSDLKTNVEVNLVGDLARKAAATGRAFQTFTTQAARNLAGLRQASIGLSNGIDRLGNRYTGLITAGAVGFKASAVIDFDAKLKDIEVQAGMTADQIAVLKGELFDVAQANGVRLDPSQLMAAVDAVIEKTGDITLARDNLMNMGVAMRAAGADGAQMGAVVAGLAKLDITAPEEVAQALEILVEQGKSGAFTMKNMAQEAGPMLASMAAMGQKGLGAVRTMGALAQTTQMATDNAAESSTAFQALIRDLAAKSKELEAVGVQLFDPEALAQGKRQFNDLGGIVRQIMEKSGGDIVKLGRLFGDESMNAFKTLAAEYQTTGGLATLDGFMGIDGTSGQMLQDAISKTQTGLAAIQSIQATLSRGFEDKLSEPIQHLADALNSLDASELNTLFDIAATGVAAAAGIWAVNKAVRGVASGVGLYRRYRTGTGAGRPGAAGIPTMAPTPVIVTNWPIGYGNGGGNGGYGGYGNGRNRGAPSRLGRLSGLGRLGRAFRGVGPVGAAFGALSLGSAAMDGDGRGMAGSVGMLGGAWAGGKLGGLVGAFAGPVGVAIGGLLGAAVGAWLGEEGLTTIYDRISGGSDEGAAELANSMNALGAQIRENTAATRDRRERRERHRGNGFEVGGLMTGAP